MVANIKNKKLDLIELIMLVEDSCILEKMEQAIHKINEESNHLSSDISKAIKPIRKNVTITDIDKEQKYTPLDYETFRIVADEVGFKEPIDELLAALT